MEVSMEYLSVDRIENDTAVCERDDMSVVELALSALPQGTKEGSVLKVENGIYSLDENEEKRRRKRILELQNMLFSDD